MNTSKTIENLAQALTKFQAAMPTLPKDASGYGYRYTPLDTVVSAIREPLAAAGLSFVQLPAIAPLEMLPAVALTTRLMHVSGEWVESTLCIPIPQVGKANDAQGYGAALTYARRYALTSMLGIVADEDTDAAAPAARQAAPRQSTPQWEDLPSANPRTNGNGNGFDDSKQKPTEKQQKALFAMGKQLYGDEWDTKRPELVSHVTKGRSDSAAHLTRKEISALLDGMKTKLAEQGE